MPIYGSPLALHVRAISFYYLALALEGKNDKTPASEAAREALDCIRTAIVYTSLMKGKRKRSTRELGFSLVEWCQFKADSRYRDKKRVHNLMRTLRRIQRDLPVTQEGRASAVAFFHRLSNECSSKGDSSSMTIGDSDD